MDLSARLFGEDASLPVALAPVGLTGMYARRGEVQAARAAGVRTLVFTVDMPVPGARYRDRHSGMSGPFAAWRRMLQAVTHPRWAWDEGLRGRHWCTWDQVF